MAEHRGWEAFREWVRETYGDRADLIIRQAIEDSFKSGGLEANNVYFQAWVEAGRPDVRPQAPPPTQAEIAASIEGPIYVDENPEPPFDVGEGFRWEKVGFEGGVPIRGEWRITPDKPDEVVSPTKPDPVAGYTWLPQYDLEGNVTSWEAVIERLPAGERTPLQQRGIDLQERGFEREERFRIEGLKEARANLETRRLANLLTPPPDFRQAQAEAKRAKDFYDFEIQRIAFLEEVRGQPRQFITEFKAGQMENPFAPSPPRTMAEEVESTEEEIARLTVAKKASDAMVKRAEHDPNISLTDTQRDRVDTINRALQTAENKLVEFVGSPEVLGETGVAAAEELGVPIGGLGRLAHGVVTDPTRPEFANLTPEDIATLTDVAREAGIVRAGPEGGFILGGDETQAPPRFRLPALPTGLQEFVPQFDRLTGQVGEIVSPSAQALGRLTFTEREQLAGVVEFGGGQFRDVLERVRRETPFAPRKGGRTRAFTQRAGVTF